MNRRSLLSHSSLAVLVVALGVRPSLAKTFEIAKTEAEWKTLLTPEQFAVLRQEGTRSPPEPVRC